MWDFLFCITIYITLALFLFYTMENQEIAKKVYELKSENPPLIIKYKNDLDRTISLVRLIQAFGWGKDYQIFNELNTRETEVYSGLLTIYNRYPELEDRKARFKLCFDKESKDEICVHFGMKNYMFINTCSSLRNKDIITYNSINALYIFPKLDDLWVKFVKI